MNDLIGTAMAAIEADFSATPNALQTHLTAANTHLAAAVEALQEKPKTEEASSEDVQLIISNWY